MPHVDLLVTAPHALTMSGAGVGYRSDLGIAVDRGRIVALGPASELRAHYAAEKTIDAGHHVLLPGFIDAHMHTALCLLRGLAQDTRYWMMYGLGPFSAQLSDEAMRVGSQLAILEGLKAGTTTFSDFGWSMNGVCGLLERAGVRGAIAVSIREAEQRIYAPGELYVFDSAQGRAQFEANLELYDRWHNAANGRLRVLFGPQGPDFVSRGEMKLTTLSPVHMAPMRNLAPNLVYAARGDEVDIVIVDGQIVVEHGQVRTLDEPAILTHAEHLGAPIGAAAESDFWQVNGPNAHMMRADQL